MSIKTTIAHGSTPHGWLHVYHESDVDSLDVMYVGTEKGRNNDAHMQPLRN